MKVSCLVIEPFDGNQPGETVQVPARQAAQLEAKGLVRVSLSAGPSERKPVAPSENKTDPLPAAGQVAPVSAPPAAQASQRTTQQPSRRGRPPGRRNAR